MQQETRRENLWLENRWFSSRVLVSKQVMMGSDTTIQFKEDLNFMHGVLVQYK